LNGQLHGQSVFHRLLGHDTDLRHIGGDVMQAVQIRARQAFTDQNKKGETRIKLLCDGGQRQRLEVSKPQFHTGGIVKIRLALGHAIVHPFEAAKGGIGKPANTNDAHDCPILYFIACK